MRGATGRTIRRRRKWSDEAAPPPGSGLAIAITFAGITEVGLAHIKLRLRLDERRTPETNIHLRSGESLSRAVALLEGCDFVSRAARELRAVTATVEPPPPGGDAQLIVRAGEFACPLLPGETTLLVLLDGRLVD
jgi:hypothetical protein